MPAAWLRAHQKCDENGVVPGDQPSVPPNAPRHVRRILLETVITALVEKDIREAGDEPLATKPLALPERGQKIRIASISPAAAVAAGQRINKFLLKLLKRTSIHGYMLNGAHGIPKGLRQGCQRWGHEKDFEINSMDLSAASDWIPHSVANAVWEAICDASGNRIPLFYQLLGHKCLGPMKVQGLPETLNEYNGRTTTNGILMGLPLTWPILSLLNEYASDRACADFLRDNRAQGHRMPNSMFRHPGTHRPFAIGGDDFIGAWTKRHTAHYEKRLEKLGLKVNHHKTFKSKVGGVFLEKLFILRDKHVTEEYRPHEADTVPQTPTLWAWIEQLFHPSSSTTKVVKRLHLVERPLLSALVSAKNHGQRDEEGVPAYLSLPTVLRNEFNACKEPWRRKALLALSEKLHSSTYSRWKKSDMPIHWPQSLGGWGVPGKPEAPRLYRKAAAIILNGQRHVQKKLLVNFVTSRAPKNLRRILDKQVDMVTNLPEQLSPSDVIRKDLTHHPLKLREAVSEVTARTLSFYALDPNSSNIETRKAAKVATIAGRVRRIIEEACSKWKSVNPWIQPKLQNSTRPMWMHWSTLGISTQCYSTQEHRTL